MTNIKRIALCEHRVIDDTSMYGHFGYHSCGKPAKYLHDLTDPKAKPQHLCGIHANMLKKRGIKVRAI